MTEPGERDGASAPGGLEQRRGPARTARRSRPRALARRLTIGVAVLMVVAAAVPMLARLTGIEAGPLAWLVAALPWFLFLTPIALAAALATRSWPVAGAAALQLALGVAWMAPLATPVRSQAEDPALRVLTINLAFGAADADAVVALVRSAEPDVLALQELTPDAAEALRLAGIDQLLPYAALEDRPGFTGVGLYSAVPIASWEQLDGFTSQAIRAELTVEGERLAVFCVHPMAPGVVDNSAWRADLDLLGRTLAQERLPAVVAGDMNATRDHKGLRRIEAAGYADAQDQAGAGWLPTFPAGGLLPPLVAIDHVYARDLRWVATDADTAEVAGTDHLALLVSFGERA